MAASMRHVLCRKSVKNCDGILKSLVNCSIYYTPVLHISKHWNPKFKKLRREKILWFDRKRYMNFEESTEDKNRMYAKLDGKKYPKETSLTGRKDATINVGESVAIFDDMVPNEANGKMSLLNFKEEEDFVAKKLARTRMYYSTKRTLKKYENSFKAKEMASDLQSIYIHTIKLLNDLRNKEDELLDHATAFCVKVLRQDLLKRTVKWEFVETVEPPKIISMITEEVSVKDNLIVQITVRIHSKQKLAVYDQFGRLMFGDPDLERTMLEFIVFEKHVIDEYGKWRMHGKIHPKWKEQQEIPLATFTVPDLSEEEEVKRKPKEFKTHDER